VWRKARSTPVVYYFRHTLDTSATGSSVRLRVIRSAMFSTNSCGRSRSKGEPVWNRRPGGGRDNALAVGTYVASHNRWALPWQKKK